MNTPDMLIRVHFRFRPKTEPYREDVLAILRTDATYFSAGEQHTIVVASEGAAKQMAFLFRMNLTIEPDSVQIEMPLEKRLAAVRKGMQDKATHFL